MYIKDGTGQLFNAAVDQTKTKLTQVSNVLKNPAPSTSDDYSLVASDELRRLKNQNANTKQLISCITDKQKFIFATLIEWRVLLSKVIDEKPGNLITTEKLLKLCIMENPSVDAIKQIIGKTDKRICEIGSPKAMQAAILQKLIETDGKYIEHIRTHECHNCLKTGHGPAWACPFPKIKENYKAWYKRPENQQHLHRQFNRRRTHLVEKFGEEKADEIISKTKKPTEKKE